MNTQHDIVQKIVKRRKELGISQQKLADMVSLPQSTIARIEAEIVSPRLETIVLIANALRISIDIK